MIHANSESHKFMCIAIATVELYTLFWYNTHFMVYNYALDLAMVTVSAVSDDRLSVTWTEPSSLSHLPNDTYTVTVTPNCRDGETGPDTPDPQTVPYNAAPVTISGLGMCMHAYANCILLLYFLILITFTTCMIGLVT